MNSRLPAIENALQNVQAACEKRLNQLYPAGIPGDIASRYQQELSYLKNSSQIDDFEIFRRLCLEAEKSSNLIHARGTFLGSFLCFLLGNNSLNPLPVHYYCPDCGYYEKVETRLFGIDLPSKKCPCCGRELLADGFNLPVESIWGIDGTKAIGFDYNVSPDFFPFAKRVFQDLYPENQVVPLGIPYVDSDKSRTFDIRQCGYVILPSGNTIQDYSHLISYLEDGEMCLTGGTWELRELLLKTVTLCPCKSYDLLLQLQRATGIYANELTCAELRSITCNNIFHAVVHSHKTRALFYTLNPKNYRDMVALDCCVHSTFSWPKKDPEPDFIDIEAFEEMLASESFQKYPCLTREDFFDFMIESGVDRSLAFNAYTRIWKGHATTDSKHHEKFSSLAIPEDLKKVAANYQHIFPRAHCVAEILEMARLTYYAQVDSRAFSRIVLARKHT